MAIFRIYVEKKPAYAEESVRLLRDLRSLLGITGLTGLRLLNRYDVEGIDQALFDACRSTVFSEPQLDDCREDLPEGDCVFGVEPLPGQFDQRADSCAQCIQIVSQGERPTVKTAKIYVLDGALTEKDLEAVKKYVINPVECREASLQTADTLALTVEAPDQVPTLTGFLALNREGLAGFVKDYGLAMDLDDIAFCQDYFAREEKRDPTLTEIRMIDTYWSDHCRHTTFGTILDEVEIEDEAVRSTYNRYLAIRKEVYGDREKPVCLMDLATIGAKYLKKTGVLQNLDESEEINACSVRIPVDVDGKEEDWLLMFKNETHNHPTEIEPFGGAATCIGGAIRDPLSGRSFVYQAMRVTGAADPTVPVAQTIPGKLPQRKLTTTATHGYSSYGDQIGLATGIVDELYHPGYAAKRMEIGAVVGAAPAKNVRREVPAPGDVIVLLGGRTGRDGCGGATGSSKSHNKESLSTCGAEVQKGNAPEERKLQRLFRDPEATALIKRCNDFGAGGVSVAIGELADGLAITLDAVPKKYEGLDGTELAISESQERMAVVIAAEDEEQFIAMAQAENLEAYRVAVVTESPRMVMTWRGQTIADLSREFLNTNGAVKHARVSVPERAYPVVGHEFADLREMAASLKCASRRGLVERFDGSIGAGSVLMPFGGKTQTTPAQAMAALLPTMPGEETDQASVMAWGCDPDALSADPYNGAYDAVTVSIAKLVAAGADPTAVYLTMQEFFEKLRDEPVRWGKPFAALLGALDAQLDYGAAAIGGKDSMSGSFLDRDVPPTLISFAIAPVKAGEVLSPEFKEAGHPVYLFGGETTGEINFSWGQFHKLAQSGKVKAAWAVENSIAEGVMKMSFGNRIGFAAEKEGNAAFWMGRPWPCPILAELTEDVKVYCKAARIGVTTAEPVITMGEDSAPIDELLKLNEGVLEEVYPTRAGTSDPVEAVTWDRRSPAVFDGEIARPRVVIPVFPGTNCEYDSVRACLRAGMDAETVVIRNLTPQALADSALELERAIQNAQILFLPGGFSGGDEPEGSAKLIVSFFRNPRLTDAVHSLLKHRDGLMLGICNGFQALLKLGLLPRGEITPVDGNSPTLTYNLIGRHQSRYVTTRVASVKSPWMLLSHAGDLHAIPVSHGEGRFAAPQGVVDQLIANGQIATQYVGLDGTPSMDISANPNGSVCAIEGIFSPDGRVFGKMGHSERRGEFVAKNIPGDKLQPIFESGALYFR